jgi:hypothetical protein
MKYIWLSGSLEEIEEMKEAFKANGFSFNQGDSFKITNSPFGSGEILFCLEGFSPSCCSDSTTSTVGCRARR